MIGRLSGIILEKTPPNLILMDVHGVGYAVELPMSSFCLLPKNGEPATLHIQHILREDASLLYGFFTLEEREAFRLLIKVSGIGPRSAIVILSGLEVTDLYYVIQNEDIQKLMSVPGVGKKTAERLIVELRDKITILMPAKDSLHSTDLLTEIEKRNALTDAIMALTTLGYNAKNATKMVKDIASPELNVDELVRRALQKMMKNN